MNMHHSRQQKIIVSSLVASWIVTASAFILGSSSSNRLQSSLSFIPFKIKLLEEQTHCQNLRQQQKNINLNPSLYLSNDNSDDNIPLSINDNVTSLNMNENNNNQTISTLDTTITSTNNTEKTKKKRNKYILGNSIEDSTNIGDYWVVSRPVDKQKITATSSTTTSSTNKETSSASSPTSSSMNSTIVNNQDPTITTTKSTSSTTTSRYDLGVGKNSPVQYVVETNQDSKQIIATDAEGKYLSRALWLYGENKKYIPNDTTMNNSDIISSILPSSSDDNQLSTTTTTLQSPEQQQYSFPPTIRYEDIDLSIPPSVYDPTRNIDHVWALLRKEALEEAQREPLLVSFLFSAILNHPTLESALAFHLANLLSSPSMISTQLMKIILEAFLEQQQQQQNDEGGGDGNYNFGRYVRADIMAVRDRDPACTCLPDVFLHFKGFHALQTHRVAHYLWKKGKKTLAHYLQSRVSQNFQIDIHPNATLGSGIMLDHGTGIVIGETAVVGHNCSLLHHVTLGGSGKKGVDRHPKVGNGVLLGAGSSVLGNIHIGDGCQVGAGTLVISSLPAHSVAVGVPARIIGTFKEQSEPSRSMNQLGTKESIAMMVTFESEGI